MVFCTGVEFEHVQALTREFERTIEATNRKARRVNTIFLCVRHHVDLLCSATRIVHDR